MLDKILRNPVYIIPGILIILIPIGAFIFSQRLKVTNEAKTKTDRSASTVIDPKEIPPTSPEAELKKLLEEKVAESSPSAKDNPPPKLETSLSFGPTLSLKISIEGRPKDKYGAKVFVGVAAGSLATSPKYILSFSIDVPDSGLFSGISLAGLNPGTSYTAYVKTPGQIATASSFTMKPTETSLNNGLSLTLLSGDLNEDNTVNSADFAVIKNSYLATNKSDKWNTRADFNLDGVINSGDVRYILKNFGKTGLSGAWQSTPLISSPSAKPASGSANPAGGLVPTNPSTSGYWLWIPDL